jgi:hypothetical protein
MGGGVYRPGGAVTAPRVIREVRPTYTNEALSVKDATSAVVPHATVILTTGATKVRALSGSRQDK